MSIKIPVSASINAAEVGAEIDKLGRAIAQANKVKYEPVSGTTIKNLEQVERKFRNLLQINREMARRVNLSGQGDKGFFDIDFSKVYENPQTRARKMQQAFQYVTGGGFSSGGRGSSTGGAGGAITNAVTGAAQAGLRATNGATAGVGGVVANSIGAPTIGAGLAGLMGGILALGVGKIVGAAVEKLDEAESNAWANDRLKRMIGDTQVSFKALQGVVESGSKSLSVTYAEGGRLATQFAKLGNVTPSQYGDLGDEITNAGGMSKSFGLDPSQGVNFMGQMRGLRLTQDTNDSRKLGLIIGETIAKSGAFSKADEVMEAISGYATSQARSSLSANTTGYASALAGLTSSGMVGLDVGGSSSILNRANAALQGGGAAGESSQFFTAMLGAKYGLDPFQMQAWREGGAFATLDGTFGDDANGKPTMAKEFGMKGPGGDKTLLGANIDMLREKYGNRSPGELAHATGRHLGVSMQQAMALLKYDPKQLGGIEKSLAASGFDITKLNAESISTLGRLETGGKGEMASVASDLLSRKDLSTSDREDLRSQSESGNFNKEFLMKLVASRGQEVTDGKNIHDTKVAIENMKTQMAQELIPLTQGIRDGIMYMAGGNGKKGRYEIEQDIIKLESDERQKRINRTADADINSAKEGYEEEEFKILSDPNNKGVISRQDWWQKYQKKIKDGTITNDEMKDFKHEIDLSKKFLHSTYKGEPFFSGDTNERLGAARSSRDKRIMSAEERRKSEIEKENAVRTKALTEHEKSDRVSSEKSLVNSDELRKDVAAAEREIGAPDGLLWAQMEQESRFNPNAKSRAGAMGLAQIMPATLAEFSRRAGRKLNPYDPKDAVYLQKETMKENYAEFGNWDDAARAYNGGWRKKNWNNPETTNYLPSIMRRRAKWGNVTPPSGEQVPPLIKRGAPANEGGGERIINDAPPLLRRGTPMPEQNVAAAEASHRFILDAQPIEVIHKNERGEPTGQRQMLTTSIRPAAPFGTERFS